MSIDSLSYLPQLHCIAYMGMCCFYFNFFRSRYFSMYNLHANDMTLSESAGVHNQKHLHLLSQYLGSKAVSRTSLIISCITDDMQTVLQSRWACLNSLIQATLGAECFLTRAKGTTVKCSTETQFLFLCSASCSLSETAKLQ